MNLDIPRLVADIRALEERIRDVKRPLRMPWTEPMHRLQAELLELAEKVTALYTLRAWARGRLHRRHPPAELRDMCRSLGRPVEWDATEHNREIAEPLAQRYSARSRERSDPRDQAERHATIA